ncbi:MAG: hypothetical protein ACXVHD_20005, partial [Solirubrobacteraceae bacterium]
MRPAAHLARTPRHLLGAHLHPLVRRLVVVVHAPARAVRAGDRAAARLSLRDEQLGTPAERLLVLGPSPCLRCLALSLEPRPPAVKVAALTRAGIELEDLIH